MQEDGPRLHRTIDAIASLRCRPEVIETFSNRVLDGGIITCATGQLASSALESPPAAAVMRSCTICSFAGMALRLGSEFRVLAVAGAARPADVSALVAPLPELR